MKYYEQINLDTNNDIEHEDVFFIIIVGYLDQWHCELFLNNHWMKYFDIQNNRGIGRRYQPKPTADAENLLYALG